MMDPSKGQCESGGDLNRCHADGFMELLDGYLAQRREQILHEIEELESIRPGKLDRLDEQIAWNGKIAVLEGRSVELHQLREQKNIWQHLVDNSFNK